MVCIALHCEQFSRVVGTLECSDYLCRSCWFRTDSSSWSKAELLKSTTICIKSNQNTL